MATAIVTVCGVAWALAMGTSGCITAPPAELPVAPAQGPVFLHDVVFPPANQDLMALPEGGFIVSVRPGQPDPSFEIRAFVDFDPGLYNDSTRTITSAFPTRPVFQVNYGGTSDTLDGGVYIVPFSLRPDQLGDPNVCHWIDVFVAQSFPDQMPAAFQDPYSEHTPAAASDSISWRYVPDPLNGCLQFDAGSSQDGAFPPDAPSDAPLLAPGVGTH